MLLTKYKRTVTMFWRIGFVCICSVLAFEQPNPNNFGPYEPIWTRYEVCRGAKLRNASNTDVIVYKKNDNFYGNLRFNFLTKSTIDEAKIWLYTMKSNTKKPLWTYKVKDPCQHFVISEIIEKELNGHNCVIEKAFYNRTVNFTEITRKLLGPSFFYGKYSMKSVISAKSANILCLIVEVEIMKKSP